MLDAPQRTFLDSRNREAQDETALLMRQGALEVGIPQATNAHKGRKFNVPTPCLPGSQRYDTRRPTGHRGNAPLFR